MKNLVRSLLFVVFSLTMFACTHQVHRTKTTHKKSNVYKTKKHKNLPPGQAKKVYGTKSAKPFAPGQQKKHKKVRKNRGKHHL